MKPLGKTIDHLPIEDHVRWADDQNKLDPILIKDTPLVASHSEIMGMSLIFPSKFEELFELQKNSQHWAEFSAPKSSSKWFFSHCLFARKQNPDAELEPDFDLTQAASYIQGLSDKASFFFDQDKASVLKLLNLICSLNDLLRKIHASRLQYAKG